MDRKLAGGFIALGVVAIVAVGCSENEQPAGAPPVPTSGIHVISATYGKNCGATSGNVTDDVATICQGQVECSYLVSVERVGDPAGNCAKDLVVEYECLPGGERATAESPAEAASAPPLALRCPPNG
jgi:hypothetical protein